MMDLTLLSTRDLEKRWARTEDGKFARKVKEELDTRQGKLATAGTGSFDFGNRIPDTGKIGAGEVARESRE